MATDFKDTILLPRTDFPMKADLAKREPGYIERWDRDRLYHAVLAQNEGKPQFVLHDGPPYANGHIHHGTILNKILKDIVVKFHNMSGQRAPYVPGWDCHGLPIEHQVDKELGAKKKEMSPLDVRKACREYALKFLDVQRAEFKRLGVLGEWERPYLTLEHQYESQIVRELGRFAEHGLYKGTKPVHWCWSCRTALAEAEVEYGDHSSPSIYVAFDVVENAELALGKPGQLSVVIWTTTPWTLPANRAIAYGPGISYRAYPWRDGHLVLAHDLREAVAHDTGLVFDESKAIPVPADLLGKLRCRHPLIDALTVPVLPADFVRTDSGTGLVHIAPGHGPDDFVLGQRHGVPVVSPVDGEGRFTEEAGLCLGERVFDANPKILDVLVERQRLLSPKTLALSHEYPHCWRCKKPVIFRATEQWFISMADHDLRQRALDEVEKVRWIPSWGRDRIHGMLTARPDWCLSRQRTWGVPIPAFYCEGCNHAVLQKSTADRIADIFAKEGSDAWFAHDAAELLPPGFKCPKCNGTAFRKEKDIVDVWFESGVSYAAVCEQREQYSIPVDLYLEGSDQHRGWFHSTLLAAVGTRGAAPYKTVLTHGFVVDGDGRKYSKSSQNYVPPERVIEKHGAEIFRLWVCATDFRGDLRFSDDILARLIESYRKMRNTIRFMLGNLADFDPKQHTVADDKLLPVDRYMLAKFGTLVEQVRKAYETFDLHVVYQRINEFAIVDLSAFYFDLLKDWLYCDPAAAQRRRSAQTALYRLCQGFLSLVAPVLSFTSEEAHDFLPDDGHKPKSVHLTRLPEAAPYQKLDHDDVVEHFDRMRLYRDEVTGQLEAFRAQKHHPLEARAVIGGNFEVRDFLGRFGDLAPYFSVSQVEFCDLNKTQGMTESEKLPGFAVRIEQAQGAKCGRCWVWSQYVGTGTNPALCERCNNAVAK